MPIYLTPTTMGVAPVQNFGPAHSGAHIEDWGLPAPGMASVGLPIGGPSATAPIGGTQTGGPFSAGAPPDLAGLTQMVNQLNLTAQQASNAGRIPGNAGLEQQSSNNISSLLSGQIPADILRNLTQASAERGVSMGSPGSDNSTSELLRALGLTGLDLQQTGQKDLSAADARNPGAPIFDPTSQLLTPYQAGQFGLGQGQQNIEWYKALHPNTGGGGGGYGGGGQPSGGGGGQNMDWFGQLLQQLTGQNNASQGTTYNPPGTSSTTTSVPGATLINTNQNFNDLFGNPSDPQYTDPTYGMDDSWYP